MEQSETNIQEEIMGEDTDPMVLPEDDEDTGEKEDRLLPALVPQIQNMDDYLMLHYRDYILQELNQLLVDGKIGELLDITVRSDRIRSDECCFRRFSYWRLNRCDFLIDIDVRLELRIDTPSGIDTDFFLLYAELWFSFADDAGECVFDHIGLMDNKPLHDEAWKLDKYLVPILRRDEIDENAEELWALRYPEALKDPSLRTPHNLAEKLHLSIIQKRLYQRRDTRSILFFHEGTVLVQDDWDIGHHEPPPPIHRAGAGKHDRAEHARQGQCQRVSGHLPRMHPLRMALFVLQAAGHAQ